MLLPLCVLAKLSELCRQRLFCGPPFVKPCCKGLRCHPPFFELSAERTNDLLMLLELLAERSDLRLQVGRGLRGDFLYLLESWFPCARETDGEPDHER